MTLCVKFYTDAPSGGSQHKPTVPLTALTAALEEEHEA